MMMTLISNKNDEQYWLLKSQIDQNVHYLQQIHDLPKIVCAIQKFDNVRSNYLQTPILTKHSNEARRVARHLGRSDCVVRRCWTSGSKRCHLLEDQTQDSLDRPVVEKTATSSDDNRVRVWRPRGERLNPVFALQRHTAPTADVMVWCAIAYNTRAPSVLIRDTMTAQRYVHDILQPHVLPFMQRLPGAIFQQDNAWPHTARVSQDCLCTVTTLPWPAPSPDLSPIEHIWDHLGRRFGHPTSLDELEARLQQIWNEMSQDIIHVCLKARLYRIVPSR
ncbi:transposable element Tcb2 transposase [Trichonephila clavipes]|nr:transposable element Tcb2 transposase [Trichonephila clavipes]